MLARVLWFIVTRPANSNFLPLKITWGALNVAAQISFIVGICVSFDDLRGMGGGD